VLEGTRHILCPQRTSPSPTPVAGVLTRSLVRSLVGFVRFGLRFRRSSVCSFGLSFKRLILQMHPPRRRRQPYRGSGSGSGSGAASLPLPLRMSLCGACSSQFSFVVHPHKQPSFPVCVRACERASHIRVCACVSLVVFRVCRLFVPFQCDAWRVECGPLLK